MLGQPLGPKANVLKNILYISMLYQRLAEREGFEHSVRFFSCSPDHKEAETGPIIP